MYIVTRKIFILYVFLGITITPSLYAMKRSADALQDQPLTADNILELPADISARIVAHLYPAERNIIWRVCKTLQFIAGKQNKDLLLSYNPTTVSSVDKKIFLDEYIANGNDDMVYRLVPSTIAYLPLWHKKRLLIDCLSLGNTPLCKYVMECIPSADIEDNALVYNEVLYQKLAWFRHKKGYSALQVLLYLIRKQKIRTYIREIPEQTLCALVFDNEATQLTESIENLWKNNAANPQQNAATLCNNIITVLHAAVLHNNTATVQAILNTTPFRTYFRPLFSKKFLQQVYYDKLLTLAYHYSSTDIFEAVFNWVDFDNQESNRPVKYPIDENFDTKNPFISLAERWSQTEFDILKPAEILQKLSPMVQSLVEMDKHEYLKSVITYARKYLHLSCTIHHWIEDAIFTKQWLCLDTVLCAIGDVNTPMCVSSDILAWYNVVLHEAEDLTGVAPLLYLDYEEEKNKSHSCVLTTNDKEGERTFYRKKIVAGNIYVLKEESPVIFEKLRVLSNRLYRQEILRSIRTVVRHKKDLDKKMGGLAPHLSYDPTLAKLMITIAQQEQKTYASPWGDALDIETLKQARKLNTLIVALQHYSDGFMY